MSRPAWRPVLRGLIFPEGPTVRGDAVACVDLLGGAVHVLRTGKYQHAEIGGRPNGAAWGVADDLIVADSGRNAVIRVALPGDEVETIWDKGLRGPNDLLVEGDAVTLTDPGDSGPQNRTGRVLRLADGGSEVLADGLAFPNGLARRDDGALIVAETMTGRLLFLKDGTIEVVAEGLRNPDGSGGPDGLAVLPGGALVAAVYGAGHLAVLRPDFVLGKCLPAPGRRPTNVCHDGETLYCTEADTGTLWACPLEDAR